MPSNGAGWQRKLWMLFCNGDRARAQKKFVRSIFDRFGQRSQKKERRF
jgi:hypothetical protein